VSDDEDPIGRLSRFDPLDASRGRGGEAGGEAGGGSLRRYVVLDVFTETPLHGNQLAVFLDGRGLKAELMQRIARELNLSETVFALPPQAGGDVRVRIFTPASELPFAGHPVLGSAIVVASALERESVTLETELSPVAVSVQRGEGRAVFGRMAQPIPVWERYEREQELLAALGVERSLLPVELYDNGPRHVYVALADEAAVVALRPDLRALAALGEIDANCFAGSGTRFKSRMFAPALGVPEDPATGSAAGPLALHLARHRQIAFGQEIEISQGAEIGRPSLLYACAVGSAESVERVEVAGAAVILAAAELLL
jgi:trans-2,3-dihydro-3-hydroxyanthranilate isomerase